MDMSTLVEGAVMNNPVKVKNFFLCLPGAYILREWRAVEFQADHIGVESSKDVEITSFGFKGPVGR